MKKHIQLLPILLIAIFEIQCAGIAPKPYLKSNVPTVRVLLAKDRVVEITCVGNFELIEKNRFVAKLPSHKVIKFQISSDGDAIDIFQEQKHFRTAASGLLVKPTRSSCKFTFLQNRYQGNLKITRDGNQIQAIHGLDMETYLKSVVPAEMGKLNKNALEALKAQAVASRTYALKRIETGKNQNYDLNADVSDQVFTGQDDHSKWTDLAVESTTGEVAAYNNVLIEAFFHSTCGGRTEAGKNVFPTGDQPYLQGVSDNFSDGDFCKDSPYYRWVESFMFEDLQADLKNNYSRVNLNYAPINDIVVAERFESGRVKDLAILFDNDNNPLLLPGNDIRKIIRRQDGSLLRSNLFKVAKVGSKGASAGFMLIGAGNGHGVGMCQWGAIGMAQKGFNYHQILKHYYRGIQIKKLY